MNLINEIINKMPNDLNDLEKARFIYIELGKLLSFDTTTKDNTYEIYFKQKIKKEIDITNLDSTKVNCHNWSDIYVSLLKTVNIKASKKAKGHAWVILYIDNYTICADATAGFETDLARIKANLTTNNFSLIDEDDTDDLSNPMFNNDFETLIDNIDKKIGYDILKENAHQKLEQLKKEVNNIENLKEKINYIFSHIDFNNFGFFEGNEYIKYILNLCLSHEIYVKIKAVTLSKTNLNGEIESIKCLTIDNKPIPTYYIFVEYKGIFEIDKSTFEKLSQMGYGIENYKSIIGINSIKDFKVYDYTPKDHLRLKKENLYTRMYANDKNLKLIIKKDS